MASPSSPKASAQGLSVISELLICLVMFNEGVQIQLIYPMVRLTVRVWSRLR